LNIWIFLFVFWTLPQSFATNNWCSSVLLLSQESVSQNYFSHGNSQVSWIWEEWKEQQVLWISYKNMQPESPLDVPTHTHTHTHTLIVVSNNGLIEVISWFVLGQQRVCQLHYGLAIYIKKYFKAKEELWKLKYPFHHAKIHLIFQKNPLKETKILQHII